MGSSEAAEVMPLEADGKDGGGDRWWKWDGWRLKQREEGEKGGGDGNCQCSRGL